MNRPHDLPGIFHFPLRQKGGKLSQVHYKIWADGCHLVLDHSLSVLEEKVIDHIDLGPHTIFIGDTVNAEVLKEERPLTYRYYQEYPT